MAKKKTRKRKMEDEQTAKRRPGPPAGKPQRAPHSRCKVFPRNVRLVLDAFGKSINGFAGDIGVPQPYLSRLLNGKYEPRLSTIFYIADALGVPVEVLLSSQLDVVKRFIAKAKEVRENFPEPIAMP